LPGGTLENHEKSQSGYLVCGPRFEPVRISNLTGSYRRLEKIALGAF
jgi:hypothetical protein